jgi:hypothetical protein
MSPFSHVLDGVYVLPILHDRLEYADLVRSAFLELRPDAVAVEIPSAIETVWLKGVARLPSVSVLLYEDGGGRTIYLPIQPADPIVEAVRLAGAHSAAVACVDLDADGYADYRDPVPDSYALHRLGPEKLYASFRDTSRATDPLDFRREASMAFHAKRLRAEGKERVLLLCGMHHAGGVANQLEREQAIPLTPGRRRGVRLVHLHPESLGEVLSEIPFYVAAYEVLREGVPEEPIEPVPETAERRYGPFRVLSGGGGLVDPSAAVAQAARAAAEGPGGGALDRLRCQNALLRHAERSLTAAAPDEKVHRWQRINLARFSRNLALSSGSLLPDLYDLLAAARGCVSENFAWELHRLATAYPRQTETATDLPTTRIRADELYDGVRRIRLVRRRRRPKRPDWRSLIRRRGREKWPGEFIAGFDSDAICSYPPEDLVIEEFGRHLKQRGKSILSEERARSVPFTTSVLDGIDVRETIRHWSEKQLYVRELGRAPGGIGSVVVIFDEDEDTYPYCSTWLGEHDQESDMAFYCTEPTEAVVGPGICRVTYGGLMMSYPPRRMADVWTDADYRAAESRGEVLLLAAIDYSTEQVVVHVAPRPPRSILTQLATRLGLKVLHVPLGTLSTSTLRKLRVMHILSGNDKRKVAKDYVW